MSKSEETRPKCWMIINFEQICPRQKKLVLNVKVFAMDATHAELQTIPQGLNVAITKLKNVVVWTDSKRAVEALTI